jgi:hypothetical protein
MDKALVALLTPSGDKPEPEVVANARRDEG